MTRGGAAAAARWAAVLLAGAWLAGCAALPQPRTPGPPPAVRLEVQAPGELRQLLERHLDLARLGELARGEALSESEWSRLIAAAPAQARALAQTEGYFDARAEVERQPAVADGPQVVRLVLEPGERVRVGRVDIEVQGELERAASAGDAAALETRQQLERGWKMPSGVPFQNTRWSDAKADLLARLRASGYAAATWSGTAADIDVETGRARLFVVAESGPLFRSGELQIEGLQAHDAETVHHLAGFATGTPLTETLLLDFQDRLRQAGLFDGVSVTFEPDPMQADAAPVRVRLTESARQVWTLGVGVSANTGPRASAEHLHRRPFGWAAITRNKLEWGRLRQAWDGEISTHPLEHQYRYLVGGAIERLESDSDVVLSQRARIGRAQDTPRIDRLVFAEVERSRRKETVTGNAAPASNDFALTANVHTVWRDLDNPILPTDGQTLSLQLGAGRAHSSEGDSGTFGRVLGRATWYRPLGRDWFAQARIELGQVIRRDSVPVPDSQQFRAGGDDSVRGYAYRSLGPVIGGAVDSGDALLTTSLELARPISRELPSVWGAVFVDAGRAAQRFSDIRPAVGAGFGIRWRSPVGPLRLDLAYGEELQKWRLHFSVGIAF